MRNLHNSGAVKIGLIGLFCLASAISGGCHRQSDRSTLQRDGQLRAGEAGRIYEGFICMEPAAQEYVHTLNDLKRMDARYWIIFDPSIFKDKTVVNAMRQQAVEMDWPNQSRTARVVWARFVGKEVELDYSAYYQGFSSHAAIAEMNRQLVIERVIEYRAEP